MRIPLCSAGDFAVPKSALLQYQKLATVRAVDSGASGIARCAALDYSFMSMALNTHEIVKNAQSSSLLKLLNQSRFTDATDPRDKIYGILGLSWDFSSGSGFVPDYKLTVREVYISAVIEHIKKHDNLDILGYCGYSAGGLNLPSWVPDWRKAPETLTGVPFEKAVETEARRIQSAYDASGETLSFGSHWPIIRDKELELCLHGAHIDVIEKLYQVSGYTDSRLTDVEKSWMPEVKAAIYTPTGETMEKSILAHHCCRFPCASQPRMWLLTTRIRDDLARKRRQFWESPVEECQVCSV